MGSIVRGAAAAAAIVVWVLVAGFVCGRSAGGLFDGEVDRQERLARSVARWTERDVNAGDFGTGSRRFDGEWMFGASMMAAMGFGQLCLEHPERADQWRDPMQRAVERMLASNARDFTREAWGDDPLDALDAPSEHAAYLGYLALALGVQRLADPASPNVGLHERITAALARDLEARPLGLLQTYPGEAYPVDNAAVVASIAVRDRAARSDEHASLVGSWARRLRERWIDRATGLLVQAVDPTTGARADAPRGSGTLLAVWFLSFADPELSRDLWDAAVTRLSRSALGFGAMAEYAGATAGRGDIDSGPIVLGLGLSATGFALAGARVHGDRERFESIWATSQLFGAPVELDGASTHATGGPLGDAILFAMVTARRQQEHR